MGGGSTTSPITGLSITLKQTSSSPPTITATVHNKNSHPVTILTYQSPLDNMALALGVLSITPAGAAKPLDLPVIMARRLWPPPPDSLVTIKPGESAGEDIVLQEPKVPMKELGDKATVFVQGKWMAVWAKGKDELTDEEIDDSTSTGFSGEYKSESLEISIG